MAFTKCVQGTVKIYAPQAHNAAETANELCYNEAVYTWRRTCPKSTQLYDSMIHLYAVRLCVLVGLQPLTTLMHTLHQRYILNASANGAYKLSRSTPSFHL